mmetsp:Transcript_22478/g.57932  ORF Transcript_22478/g.57932 Transcript_22478/m.57932 type:complete len:334 (-) Transcript_22478:693-1694(-)
MVRVNDDTEFITSDWINVGVKGLREHHPPNVGVTGPLCKQGNQAILTHDMVHRTHLDIFGDYYPAVFSNFFVDDWITHVYGTSRTTRSQVWEVVHHTQHSGTRYHADRGAGDHLNEELNKGGLLVQRYIEHLPLAQSLKNVVAFSLYGSEKTRYLDGATANAKLVPKTYPGWEMWVYHDSSVPRPFLDELESITHVRLLDMSNSSVKNPRAWRFLAASDPNVARYVFRDIDSRLSLREKAAVDQWIQSGKRFHQMRDHPSHSHFAMSAGMWGGTHSAIPELEWMMEKRGMSDGYLEDTEFLNAEVCLFVRPSVSKLAKPVTLASIAATKPFIF